MAKKAAKGNLDFSFPSPFEIALILSAVSFIGAVALTLPPGEGVVSYFWEVLLFWKMGFWDLLEFTLQMVLILVFGHALAISSPVDRLLSKVADSAHNNQRAVLLTAAFTMIAGYINWGFGLILGAILARKIAENAKNNHYHINYPLVASAGYVGMLVWHGGFSGSAPLKVAEPNHFLINQIGIIGIEQTILSNYNLVINGVLIIALLLTFFLLSKLTFSPLAISEVGRHEKGVVKRKNVWGLCVGILILALCFHDFIKIPTEGFDFVNLNFINFLLLGCGLCLHVDLNRYVGVIETAVKGATGIILQFPFYAGILGILKYSGLLLIIAGYFVQISSPDTFPLLTFFSAALINLFVPSGGGQWAVQGPVIIEAAKKMDLNIPRVIMALAYGDQLSNMLQPFWALPLLAITGVPAKELLKYTLVLFIVAALILGCGIYFIP